jgi:hypothetical protein
MDEGVAPAAVSAELGLLVDELHVVRPQPRQGDPNVLYFQADVVHAGTPLAEEARDPAFRIGRRH